MNSPNIPSNRLTSAFHPPVETGGFQARISVKVHAVNSDSYCSVL
ncbi:MAG: hypothetical protein ACFFCZ_12010 [Promethearchaeota archaeon]